MRDTRAIRFSLTLARSGSGIKDWKNHLPEPRGTAAKDLPYAITYAKCLLYRQEIDEFKTFFNDILECHPSPPRFCGH